MPYQIIANKDKKTYSVINSETKHYFSHHTTLKKAIKQINLLNSIENKNKK